MTKLKADTSRPDYEPGDVSKKEWANCRDADYCEAIMVYVYEKAGQHRVLTEFVDEMPGWEYLGPRRIDL